MKLFSHKCQLSSQVLMHSLQLDETVICLILEVNAVMNMGLLKYIKTKLLHPAKASKYPRESEKWMFTEKNPKKQTHENPHEQEKYVTH